MVTAVLTVLFGVLPSVVIFLIGLVEGTVPPKGYLETGPGYPSFQPPFWLLWIPGLIALVFSVVSIPISGKFPTYFWGSRLEMVTVAIFGWATTFTAAVAYGAEQFLSLLILTGVWMLTIALIVLRGLFGALHLVPKSWQ